MYNLTSQGPISVAAASLHPSDDTKIDRHRFLRPMLGGVDVQARH